jgi:hypothetical protein
MMNKPNDAPRDAADILYGGEDARVSRYGPTLSDNLNAIADSTGLTTAEREQRLSEFAEFFDDAQLTPDQGARLLGIVARYAATPASDEQVQAWTTRSRQLLRERYGSDAERRLETVREFVKARPFLKPYLNETGAGSHEDFLTMLAEHAHLLRMTPRTKGGANG